MSEVVRYFDDGSEIKRLVEHRTTKKVPDEDAFRGYRYVTDERYLEIQTYDETRGKWCSERKLGDYVEPKDAPHR